jgi:rhodanese-related sulfurtransferase
MQQDSIRKQFEEANPADEIIPGIWIGSQKAALNKDWLSQHRISSVFNCTKDIPFYPNVTKKFRIPVDDNLKEEEIRNLELWSYEIVFKMLQEYKTGQTILVHCAAGMQRSAASVAMFLIVLKNMKPSEAIAYIRSKRPIAFRPAANFKPAIDGFYESYKSDNNRQYFG